LCLEFENICLFRDSVEVIPFLLLQALLLTERQATEAAKREHAESELRNEELIKKFESAEKKIEQLQETVHRYNINKVLEYSLSFQII
jgi:hypothetical protein